MKKLLIAFAFGFGFLIHTAVSAKPGDVRTVAEKSDWHCDHMVAMDNKLYFISNQGIREVDKNGGSKMLPQPRRWSNDMGTALDGKLYTIADKSLYEVDKKGQTRKVGDDWSAVDGMAGIAGKLYIVNDRKLFIAEKDGKFKALGKYEWDHTNGVGAVNDKLFIVDREQVFEVDTQTGQERALNSTPIHSPGAMATGNGKIYVWHSVRVQGKKRFNETALTEVDPATGNLTRIPLPENWDDQPSTGGPMAVMDGKLYMWLSGMSKKKLVAISLQ